MTRRPGWLPDCPALCACPRSDAHGRGLQEDLAGRLYGLLITLDDRLGSEQARLLHHFIEVGEYGLALEGIAGTLAQDAIAITGQEHGTCWRWPPRMNLDDGVVPRALAACPQADGHQRRLRATAGTG